MRWGAFKYLMQLSEPITAQTFDQRGKDSGRLLFCLAREFAGPQNRFAIRADQPRPDGALVICLIALVLRAGSDPGPCRVILPAPAGLCSTYITLPEHPTVVLERPSALGRLVSPASLLMLVAAPDHDLSDAEKSAIREILSLVEALWPDGLISADVRG